ncbi:MAG: peptidylprolyl isomerase [Phycisphaerae bacterium]|nr:peptidylprolyl isomerase [Phycisphaerae bacterium]
MMNAMKGMTPTILCIVGGLFVSLGMTGEGCFQLSDIPGFDRTPPAIIPTNPDEGSLQRTFTVDLRDYPEAHRIAWEFGDGATATDMLVFTGQSVTHDYQRIGTFNVSVHLFTAPDIATGRSEFIATGTLPVDVVAPNVPPVAAFVAEEMLDANGQPMALGRRFVASRSTDPDGSIASFLWDFGDGSHDHGEIVEHAFARAGRFVVRLVVVDDRGGQASKTRTIIANTRPAPSFTYTQDLTDALTFTFDASGSSDAEGAITEYRWDFGDDSVTATGRVVTHTYAVPDNYAVVLTVTDETGAAASTTQVVDVRGTEPFVRSITPNRGEADTTLSDVVIDGENFAGGATVRLERDGAGLDATSVIVEGDTTIRMTLDLSGAASGSYHVVVTNPNGKTAQLLNGFEVVQVTEGEPFVRSISPASGEQDTTVSDVAIDGENFEIGAKVQLKRNGTMIDATSVTVDGDTAIRLTLDLTGAELGTYDVVVTNPDGKIAELPNGFEVVEETVPDPIIQSITPSTGERDATVSDVAIDGENFENGATVQLERDGATIDATSVTVESDTTIRLTLNLTGAELGAYDVVVTNPDGKTGRLSDGFEVVEVAEDAPVVASVSPNVSEMDTMVSDVEIDGENFEKGATVQLERDGTTIGATSVTVESDTTIRLALNLAGAEAGDYDVVVTNPGGASGRLAGGFTVITPNLVRLTTSLGDVLFELVDDAPITTANFMQYVEDGFYDGTIFHRVVPGFIVQGGGFLPGMEKPDGLRDPIANEFSPNRSNVRGTVAMAKLGGDPNSATSQFFVNLGDNSANLDTQNGGFTVFATVIEGMDVVDAIAAVPLDGETPIDDVLLISATRE